MTHNLLPLSSLLARASLRETWGKQVLVILGMALGIAMFTAVQLCNRNALLAVRESADALSGSQQYHVRSDSGHISESILPLLYKHPGISTVAPQSTRYIKAYTKDEIEIGTIQVIGIDLLANNQIGYWERKDEEHTTQNNQLRLLQAPPAGLISQDLERTIKGIGSPNDILLQTSDRYENISIEGVIKSDGLARAYGGRVIVVDLSTYQHLFKSYEYVDTIDFIIADKEDHESILRSINSQLPKGIRASLRPKRVRGETMVQAFSLNLGFLSGISLFVSILLNYHLMSYNALRRRKEFGILRSIGAAPSTILKLLMIESLLLGLFASILGLFLGYILAQASIAVITTTISTLYIPVSIQEIHFDPVIAIICLALGPITALAGSLIPMIEAITAPAKSTFGYQTYEKNISTIFPG